MNIPEGPICLIGLDSKHKANFLVGLKAGGDELIWWPEIFEGIPLHPVQLKEITEMIIESGENKILITQSPIVISCFNNIPDNVFVATDSDVVALTDRYEKNWLRDYNIDISDLYSSGSLNDIS